PHDPAVPSAPRPARLLVLAHRPQRSQRHQPARVRAAREGGESHRAPEREALVLKIPADTTAVAAGLQPMSTALDGLKTTAAATSEQLGALSDKRAAPALDTA